MQDVVIIGGGPAGLSAAVNAAAEGLETMLIAHRIGGQAGTSSRIENFIGFPEGISGPDLAHRTCQQARKFGALIVTGEVCDIHKLDDGRIAVLHSNGTITYTKTVIVACGVQYNEPDWARNLPQCHGIHYAATPAIGRSVGGKVVVVGGGNSAGQAALYMSKRAHVTIVVRNELSSSMSHYLLDRISSSGKIDIIVGDEIEGVDVIDRYVHGVRLKSGTNLECDDIFIMIGANPNCSFADVEVNDKGFIRTNSEYQTNLLGVWAVGDIRAGSVKRVASSSGEGAACIQHVYKWIHE